MLNFIAELWNAVIFEPIFNLIIALIALVPGHNFGVALIIFTVLTRFVFYPIVKKQLQNVKKQKEIQPEIARIKKANKGNRQKESMEIMALYRERGLNPFAVLGYLIIQLPIFIGLYQVVRRVSAVDQNLIDKDNTYGFIQNLSYVKELATDPSIFDSSLFGIIDLARPTLSGLSDSEGGLVFYLGSLIIVVAAVFVQYLTAKQMSEFNKPTEDGSQRTLREIFKEQREGKEVDQTEINAATTRMTNKMFLYGLPALIFFFSLGWASAIPFYLFISGVMQYYQQKHINKQEDKTAVKAVINGQDTVATFTKTLNAKQKKEQRAKTFSHQTKSKKRVSATVKTISKKDKR